MNGKKKEMTDQSQVQKLFQASIEKANKRFDEAFKIILEGTNLQNLIVNGGAALTVYIPVGGHRTSWGEDLAEFIKFSFPRFTKRVLDLTENKIILTDNTLYNAGVCNVNDVVFQEINFQTCIYSILKLNFLFKID